MAIMSSFPSEDREKYIGIVEAANGVGLLSGPMLGALLYYIGGFCFPFYALAGLCSALLPCIYALLYSANNQIKLSNLKSSEENIKQPMELCAFFKKPRFLFGLFSQMFVIMTLQYIAPNISTHLETFDFSPP